MELGKYYFAFTFAAFFASFSKGLISLMEGEPANLPFQYPCNSTKVTLQHGYQSPFYKSTSAEYLLTPDQQGRYTVENKNGSGDACSLVLTISEVKRSDEGTFICQVYKDSELLPQYPRIGLQINYPPGKPSCELSNSPTLEGWSVLSCTAPVGSLPGQIGCFQDTVPSPPVLDPTKTTSVLSHEFWVRHTYPVFCCSFISDRPTERCDCKDFMKVPHESGSSATAAEPCPLTTPAKHSSKSHSNPLTTSTRSPFTTQVRTTTEIISYTSSYWTFGLAIGILVFVILILGIFIVYYYRAFKKAVWNNSPEAVELKMDSQ